MAPAKQVLVYAALAGLAYASPAPQQIDFMAVAAAPTVANGPKSVGIDGDATASLYTSFTVSGAVVAPSAPVAAPVAPRSAGVQTSVISKNTVDASMHGSLGSAGVNTTVAAGVSYWLSGGLAHQFFGNLLVDGSLFVSQSSFLQANASAGGLTSGWSGSGSVAGNLQIGAGGLFQINDINSGAAASFDWDLNSLLVNGALQWCGVGNTGGSSFSLSAEADIVINGLISFEQAHGNDGSAFYWKNPNPKSYKSSSNIYNNGAFRLRNVNLHNVQNIYGSGCWELDVGATLYLETGTGIFQIGAGASVFAGQSISFTDASAVLHLDAGVYVHNSNFGARIYGFAAGNAIEFADLITWHTYNQFTGMLTVYFVTGASVNLHIGTGYQASGFVTRLHASAYNTVGFNAIFYVGAAVSVNIGTPAACSIPNRVPTCTPVVPPPTTSVPAVGVSTTLSWPSISVPTLSLPTLTLPSISVPTLSVPTSIPSISVPSISVPSISVPSLSIPSISAPTLSFPSISVPSLSIPSLSLTSVSLPVPSVCSVSISISTVYVTGNPSIVPSGIIPSGSISKSVATSPAVGTGSIIPSGSSTKSASAVSGSASGSGSASPSASGSAKPSGSVSASVSSAPSASVSGSASPSVSGSVKPSGSVSVSGAPSGSVSASLSGSSKPSGSASPSVSGSVKPSGSGSSSASSGPSGSASASVSGSSKPSGSASPSASVSASAISTGSSKPSGSASGSASASASASGSSKPSGSVSGSTSASASPSASGSSKPSGSISGSASSIASSILSSASQSGSSIVSIKSSSAASSFSTGVSGFSTSSGPAKTGSGSVTRSSVLSTAFTAPPTSTLSVPTTIPTSCPYSTYTPTYSVVTTPYYPALASNYTTDPALTGTTTAGQACPTQPEAGTYCGFINPEDPCSPQPDGFGPVPSPDTASAFLAYSPLHSMATAAPTVVPSTNCTEYVEVFQDLNAAVSAQSYLGLYTLQEYDVYECALKCDETALCTAFNIYAERDPMLNPSNNDSTAPTVWGYYCPNPPSITNYKCTLWGSNIDASDATNTGEGREQFQVVITASNGYDKTNDTIPANPTVPISSSTPTVTSTSISSSSSTSSTSSVATSTSAVRPTDTASRSASASPSALSSRTSPSSTVSTAPAVGTATSAANPWGSNPWDSSPNKPYGAPGTCPWSEPENCHGKAINGGSFWLGSRFFPGPYNPQVCSDYALEQNDANAAAGANQSCEMFNAYYLHKNGAPHGTYCSLYNSHLDVSFATYAGGEFDGDVYECRQSWTWTLSAAVSARLSASS